MIKNSYKDFITLQNSESGRSGHIARVRVNLDIYCQLQNPASPYSPRHVIEPRLIIAASTDRLLRGLVKSMLGDCFNTAMKEV